MAEGSIVGIFPAVEQRCLQNISVYKTPDGSFLFVQVGIAAVQQLHAGRDIAVPADENRAAADKRTGVRCGLCRWFTKPPHPPNWNIPFKERKQLLFFYWCARNHMAEVDAIDVVSVAECIDLFQLIEIFRCDDKG